VDVKLVNVVFSARDRAGTFVKDLRKEDVEVREDGRIREIAHFGRDTDTPLTVALLIDVSGSALNILDVEKVAASRFFHEVLRQGDRAALVGFAQYIAVWQDLTPSLAAIDQALERAAPFTQLENDGVRPRGGTLLFDAVALVADRKLRKAEGRKAMILITDGLDNGSRARLDHAARSAQESDAVVYGIHYMDADLEAVYSARGLTALEKISHPTGGRTFAVGGRHPLEKVFDTIREEMRSQYTLAFKPVAEVDDGEWHKLEVRTKAGHKVSTRSGYFSVKK
jgi:VWFA-related protein